VESCFGRRTEGMIEKEDYIWGMNFDEMNKISEILRQIIISLHIPQTLSYASVSASDGG